MNYVKKFLAVTVFIVLSAVMLSVGAFAGTNSVKFTNTQNTVYSYLNCVQLYLRSEHRIGVDAFVPKGIKDQHLEYNVSWDFTGDGLKGYTFEYSVNGDFSDSHKVELPADKNTFALCNLLKGQKYYMRVTAHTETGDVLANSSFTTTDLGPRILYVGGYYCNFRDVGGYKLKNGRTTLQNMVIRGSAPDNCKSADKLTLTEEGYKYLTEELCVGLELDLRADHENCGRTDNAALEGAKYLQIPLTAYSAAFDASQAEMYRDVFRAFADRSNYPIYFHCAGGADRTGTVALILEAMLGYDYDYIITDYELTSFSSVGIRDKVNIEPVLNKLEAYGGKTLQENAERYLRSIGITQSEINSIKAIMTGTDAKTYLFNDVPESSYFYAPATWGFENGIVSGTGNGIFSPNAVCTRAQALYMIWKNSGSPEVSDVELPFTDVAASAYYRKAVEWAYANEITCGTSAECFSPDLPCSRAEMICFLWGSAGMPQNEDDENTFSDVGVNNWYYVPVMWAYENGIVYGTEKGVFSPKLPATRAQMITVLYKY